MIFYSLNFPIKKPLNTVPPPLSLASPTPHPPPPPSPARPRLQESRGERILRSAHAQQQDSTRMYRGYRWLTASTRTLSACVTPTSDSSAPSKVFRNSFLPRTYSHRPKSSDRRQRGAFSWTFEEYHLLEAQSTDSAGNWTTTV
ncbi:uncharacterized protein LOC123502262 [Portunus trituberculatus]|uniref:uncharacterized protein LOC123502262 n=1 Tax=Portunus trituberculatus TaxID=210409 RepID=UPI001E1CD082|nr:uncharacterized protein LOC123502262 [Portunus trituberculatus]